MEVEPKDRICDKFIPFDAAVVFDWDNTLKVIDRKNKRIECRVTSAFLKDLIKVKRCELYIISAISPSRINMDTLLMEVDRLGIRELFCRKCQQELHSTKHVDTFKYECACEDEEEEESKTGTMEIVGTPLNKPCPHDNKIKTVNGQHHYVHWENIVISGYDKAEVFLELIGKEYENLGGNVGPQSPVTSKAEEHFKAKSRSSFEDQDEVDGLTVDKAENYVTKSYDQVERSREVFFEKSFEREVVFFDDEEINIHNFSRLVKNSKCYLVQ